MGHAPPKLQPLPMKSVWVDTTDPKIQELVESLNYWLKRRETLKELPFWLYLFKSWRRKIIKWKRDCNKMIVTYQEWIKETKVEVKDRPPLKAPAPAYPPNDFMPLSNYLPPAEIANLANVSYSKYQYEKIHTKYDRILSLVHHNVIPAHEAEKMLANTLYSLEPDFNDPAQKYQWERDYGVSSKAEWREWNKKQLAEAKLRKSYIEFT